MKSVTKEMLKIYKPESDMDWMNYKLVKRDLTFHHIHKRVDGGKETIDNGALLMPVAHQYLNLIEIRDIKTYDALNRIFKIVNNQQAEPNSEQREIIEYLLQEFERLHKNDRTKKGKRLIQYKYIQRQF